MPKVAMATQDDVEQLKSELKAEVASVKASIGPAVSTSEKKILGQLTELSNTVGQNKDLAQKSSERVTADSIAHTEAVTKKLHKELSAMFPPLEGKIQQAEVDMEAKLGKVDLGLRSMFAEELGVLCQRFDEELSRTKEEIFSQIEARAQQAEEARNALQKSVVGQLETERDKATEAREKLRADVDSAMKQAEAQQVKRDQERDEKAARVEAEIWLQLDRLKDGLNDLREDATNHANSVKDGAAADLASLREDHGNRVSHLDSESMKLRDAVAEVENLSTRRVDWVIRKASYRMRPSSASRACLHTSYFSPKFNMAGAHGLQLEIQIFRAGDPPVPDEAQGDCAVFLWACKGMSLVYKLSVGGKSATLEKVFNGRVPYGTKRLCFLRDQVNKEDDTLRVSVEILEAVREIEHPIKPPPPAENGEEVPEELNAAKPLEGLVVFRRHVNNRLMDQVNSQVEIMRSRMVRRVEWRLEYGNMLRRCFPNGDCMCSATFAAAGVEGMQLIFYPSGYGDVTDGYCSLFLYAPAGSTLKCTLWAGDQKRDATHTFQEPGAFGRTNFCRFEQILDEVDNTIILALDIEEAHQDVQATVAHPLVAPGDRRSQNQIEGAGPAPVTSVVKLQRAPGRKAPGPLEDLRVLPSMWTATSLSDKTSKKDGMHSFDELGSRRGDHTSPAGSPGTRRSESMPSLKEQTGGGSDMVPLPFLTKTTGSDFCADGGKARKGRGPRSLAGAASPLHSA